MQSLKSRKFVKETFSWQHYYWVLTEQGTEYLRKYLNLPANVKPETQKDQQPQAIGGDSG